MRSVIIQPGETLPDIAVRYLGSIDAWSDIAKLNGIGLTSGLSAGQVLQLPEVTYNYVVAARPEASTSILVVVEPGQSLADIAIQWCGNTAEWPSIAALNGVGLTDTLSVGTAIIVPAPNDKRVAQYFKRGGYKPSTGEITALEGIDYWFIELDFKVS